MNCPACRKKVVFGSVRSAEAWSKLLAGEWLLGSAPPAPGVLGDCPACGMRLEWEPGEAPGGGPGAATQPARVHLFALRESAQKYDLQRIALRAIVVEHAERAYLSDSWRNTKKGATPEPDSELLERLAREQKPLVSVRWAVTEMRDRFLASCTTLANGIARAAWAEIAGSFRAGDSLLSVEEVSSVWPPKD